MIEYTTESGIALRIGRVPRRAIDDFVAANPMPEPPTRKVLAWGNLEEDLPVLDDPAYQAQLVGYYLTMAREQVPLVAPAVSIPDWTDEMQSDLDDLAAVGLASGDQRTDYLRFVVTSNEQELAAVVAMVLYNSTVTQRGIAEAEQAFNVTWSGKPVMALNIPGTLARQGDIYLAREAARFGRMTWQGFSALWGPEQSAAVAHYRIQMRLTWLGTRQQ